MFCWHQKAQGNRLQFMKSHMVIKHHPICQTFSVFERQCLNQIKYPATSQCDVPRIRRLKNPSSRTGVHCRKRGFLLLQTWQPTCGLIIHYQLHCRSVSLCQGLHEFLLSTTNGLIGYTFCFFHSPCESVATDFFPQLSDSPTVHHSIVALDSVHMMLKEK